MSPAPTAAGDAPGLVALALRAWELTRSAVTSAGAALTTGETRYFQQVDQHEAELDVIDREMDERVAGAIRHLPEEQARELLACLKLTIDLERIGDLVAGFAQRAQAVAARLEPEDLRALADMITVLERMLTEAYRSYSGRDLNRALWVLRADSEVDRLRNLIFLRHLNRAESSAGPDSLHVLSMAQSLERAGDHTKNLAEEVIHFATGHSVRHVLKTRDHRSSEQMFLEWLRAQQAPSHP